MNVLNKKKEIINYDGVCVIYKKENNYIGLIKKHIKKIVQEMKDFYKFKNLSMVIELFYSRKEFDKKIGYKTPEWLVGFARKNNIYLFSPSVMEKVSSHKKSEIKKILTHEICHIFNDKINKNPLMWVDEGMALLLAGQKKNNDFAKKDLNLFYNNFFCENIRINYLAAS